LSPCYTLAYNTGLAIFTEFNRLSFASRQLAGSYIQSFKVSVKRLHVSWV